MINSEVKDQTLRRLSIIEGHVKKISQMIENEDYCADVIHQSQAVQAALKKIDEIVLKNHLQTCVMQGKHDTKAEKEKLTEELVDLFRKNSK